MFIGYNNVQNYDINKTSSCSSQSKRTSWYKQNQSSTLYRRHFLWTCMHFCTYLQYAQAYLSSRTKIEGKYYINQLQFCAKQTDVINACRLHWKGLSFIPLIWCSNKKMTLKLHFYYTCTVSFLHIIATALNVINCKSVVKIQIKCM
jgi:hypothetical protein